jgi:hypothetical protein
MGTVKSGLEDLVRAALMAAAFSTGCGSASLGPDTRSDANTAGGASVDGALESGSLAESGGSADGSTVSMGDASIESGSTDSPSSDSGGDASASTDSAESESGDGPSVAIDSEGGAPEGFFVRYEAESPLNTLTYFAEVQDNDYGLNATCPGTPGTSSDGVKEGAICASSGKIVVQLLGRSPCTSLYGSPYVGCKDLGAGVQFNAVTVPDDGTYDVTFWYHSGEGKTAGQADTFGDSQCGGVNYDTGPGSGCRPCMIAVNGVQMSGTVGGQDAVYYEFPAYGDSFTILHGAVAALPLKAGSNTIALKAPGFMTSDAPDIDALDVQPSGLGAPVFQKSGAGGAPTLPIGLITPVVYWNTLNSN